MTDKEAAATAARAEAATPGPWQQQGDAFVVSQPLGASNNHIATCDIHTDAAFIAHAREDIPALLAERVALRASITELLHGLKAFFDEKGLTWESAAMRAARALLADEREDSQP